MTDIQDLAELRKKIDAVDDQLVGLLNERARLALQVGIAKGGQNIRRPEREAEVLRRVAEGNVGPLSNEGLQTIFEQIIEICRMIQYNK